MGIEIFESARSRTGLKQGTLHVGVYKKQSGDCSRAEMHQPPGMRICDVWYKVIEKTQQEAQNGTLVGYTQNSSNHSLHIPDEKQLSRELAREGVVRHGGTGVVVGSSVTAEVNCWPVSHHTRRQRAQDGERLEP